MPSLLERSPATTPATRAGAGRRLLAAFQAFEGFPALQRAREEMLADMGEASSNPARVIKVVESDPALTIAVLRGGGRSSRASKPADGPRRSRAADPGASRADRVRREHLRLLRAVAPMERRRRSL